MIENHQKGVRIMKRFLLLVLILMMCAGCSIQSNHQKNDDTYEFAKTMAIGHIETVLGYDPESNYSLHKVKGNQDEFPYIYQVSKDNEPILHIEFEYDTAVHYGGMSFDYKEGYLIPTIKDKYFKNYKSDEYLYSAALNQEMEYEDYRDVVVHHLDVNYDQEVMDKVMHYITLDTSMLPAGIEIHDGDLIQLGTPIPVYGIGLNEENKTIEVSQRNYFDYPVYINHELKCLAGASFYEAGSSFGFKNLDEFPPLLTTERFIRLGIGTAYYQNFFVTEDGISNPEDIKYPLYVDKVFEQLQNIVKELESSSTIVAARYIESEGFTEEDSLNPEAYRAAEDFISSDYNGTVKIVDEDILYDPDYNELGYNYSLTYYGGGIGHVVVLKKGSSYFVNEMAYSVNPYEGLSKDVIRVYAGPFGYFYYLENGMLMDLRTNEEVDPANVIRYKLDDE